MGVKMLLYLELVAHALNLHTCWHVKRYERRSACAGLFVCLVRLMWHGGHFCQFPYPSPCCDVKGTVKRQPRGSAGTAALCAPFPPWQPYTLMRIQPNTSTFIAKWRMFVGKPPQGEDPRIAESLQNKHHRLPLTDCLLEMRYVVLCFSGRMGNGGRVWLIVACSKHYPMLIVEVDEWLLHMP